jgi:hypothetical protein
LDEGSYRASFIFKRKPPFLRSFMDSNEAQQLLLEVLQVLEYSALDSFSVAEVKGDSLFATGYVVVVRAFLSVTRKQQVYDIAKKHGLIVLDEKEGLTLYKPKGFVLSSL